MIKVKSLHQSTNRQNTIGILKHHFLQLAIDKLNARFGKSLTIYNIIPYWQQN